MPDQSSEPTNHHLLRVLIVDDVPDVRQELRLLLELTGELQVIGEAANGLEAMARVDVLRPDVVVMDLEMPVMDGYAATRRIKAASPACGVIALTIHGDQGERLEALEAGMADVVVKGAPLEELLQAIRSAAAQECAPAGDSA